MVAYEINFDGLAGPTYNYSGLSLGDVAHRNVQNKVSNPRKAALQGLAKMKFLHDLGLKQAVLPPHPRPSLSMLRRLGFSGSDQEILQKAAEKDPVILAGCSSSSAMWLANAATVSPSADTADGKVHFTPANLASRFHRSFERKVTTRVLKKIFSNSKYFIHHFPLPSGQTFGDEGAANHSRFCDDHESHGIEFFVFGRHVFRQATLKPKYFPARQTFEASQAIIRLHQLDPEKVVCVQQNPIAIDAGVFHNDMVALANRNVLLYHEQAFLDTPKVVQELQTAYDKLTGNRLCLINVGLHEVTLTETVQTCFFNSQLIDRGKNSMLLLAPIECEENRIVKKTIEKILSNNTNPITEVHYMDLKQSMHNGGGPASLRLKFVLKEDEFIAMQPSVVLSDRLYKILVDWVIANYREELVPEDLADPLLLRECRKALDELTQILELGSIYDFQINAAQAGH